MEVKRYKFFPSILEYVLASDYDAKEQEVIYWKDAAETFLAELTRLQTEVKNLKDGAFQAHEQYDADQDELKRLRAEVERANEQEVSHYAAVQDLYKANADLTAEVERLKEQMSHMTDTQAYMEDRSHLEVEVERLIRLNKEIEREMLKTTMSNVKERKAIAEAIDTLPVSVSANTVSKYLQSRRELRDRIERGEFGK